MAHQTEDAGHKDELAFTRTHSKPHHLLMSVDPSQQVVDKNEETQHRCRLVTLWPSSWRIVTSSSAAPSSAKKSQANPTVMCRALWPNTTHKGNRTRHHDHCPWTVR